MEREPVPPILPARSPRSSGPRSPRDVTLQEILTYSNRLVIDCYLRDHGGTRRRAERLFTEMLKWLFLCHRAEQRGAVDCFMLAEIAGIDDMWHTFILATADYAEFCDRYFGTFIHHQPLTARKGPNPQMDRDRLQPFLKLVYEVLGERTLVDWVSGRFANA